MGGLLAGLSVFAGVIFAATVYQPAKTIHQLENQRVDLPSTEISLADLAWMTVYERERFPVRVHLSFPHAKGIQVVKLRAANSTLRELLAALRQQFGFDHRYVGCLNGTNMLTGPNAASGLYVSDVDTSEPKFDVDVYDSLQTLRRSISKTELAKLHLSRDSPPGDHPMRQIISDLEMELLKQVGLANSAPVTVRADEPGVAELEIDFVAIDSMSCSFVELRLTVPSLVNADMAELKKWGEGLCQRVTYLLENIGPLEIDEDAGELLIRSTPPQQQPSGTKFYEIILQSHANGSFTLKRYESERGVPGRQPVEIQLTHEVLFKLVDDLLDTIP